MLREKILQIIAYESSMGFERGVNLFLEELNEEMEKEEALLTCGVDNYMDFLVENSNI